MIPAATLLWAIPAVAALGLARATDPSRRHLVSGLAASVTFLLAAGVAATWTPGAAWEDRLPGLPYHVGIDGVNLLFLPLVSLLGALVSLYGWEVGRRAGAGWHVAVLLLQAAITGQLVSMDYLTSSAFQLLEVGPVVWMVRAVGTGAGREEAARRVGRALGAAWAFWTVGALVLAAWHHDARGAWSTDLTDLTALAPGGAHAAFWLLFAALAVRGGQFPFHGWFPLAVSEGPVAGLSVLLLGVKVAIVGVIRFLLPVMPESAAAFAPWATGLGVAGLIYGAVLALVQRDLRRMLAFFAVSHTGFVLVGAFDGDVVGVSGAVLEALNLGVAAAGMYFAAGFLWLRARSTDIDALRPVASAMPRFGLMFLFIAMAGVGMPGTLGFEAIHLEVEASLAAHHYGIALLQAGATLLFAAALLSWYQRLFLAQDGDRSTIVDLRPRELAIALALGLLLAVGGLRPTPWVDAVEHAVADVLPGHHLPHGDPADAHDTPTDLELP